MKRSTHKYSFLYKSDEKTIAELINYLEKTYGLKFLTTFDIKSFVSLGLPLFSIDLFNKKEVMFEAPNTFGKIKLCMECRFPAELSEMEPSTPHPEAHRKCKNCGNELYRFSNGEFIEIDKKRFILQNG